MKRGRALAVLAGALSLTALSAFHFRHRARAASHYEPPVLVDPPPGPRAPSAEILGARVGSSRLAEVRALTNAAGIACADRSVRVLMGEIRDKKRIEIEEAKRKGTPDLVSGASIVDRRTARDENPQVRFSCEGVASSRLPDRARTPSSGRLLYVFDDAAAPLRHVSYQRNHSEWAAALTDFTEARGALAARLGAAQESHSEGTSSASPEAPLPKYARRVAEWRFSDLVASVSLGNLGGRGFSVTETLEVPLPLRADAKAH